MSNCRRENFVVNIFHFREKSIHVQVLDPKMLWAKRSVGTRKWILRKQEKLLKAYKQPRYESLIQCSYRNVHFLSVVYLQYMLLVTYK